ncbi:MAG: hypothetical protein WAN35_01545 [Terracidiphilus sp.]
MLNAIKLTVVLLFTLALGACSRMDKSISIQTGTATNEKAVNGENPLLVEASSALKNYCDLESNQNYEKIYGLLSEHKKKSFVKYQVRSASQYKKFRDSSEARWSDFVFDKKNLDGDNTMIVEGHAKIEESGEIESVTFNARLIQENGAWKIDDWKY